MLNKSPVYFGLNDCNISFFLKKTLFLRRNFLKKWVIVTKFRVFIARIIYVSPKVHFV